MLHFQFSINSAKAIIHDCTFSCDGPNIQTYSQTITYHLPIKSYEYTKKQTQHQKYQQIFGNLIYVN